VIPAKADSYWKRLGPFGRHEREAKPEPPPTA
jgi:hypothetical protein